MDDVEKACERFEKLGVKFQKKPSDGKMRHIAFILDPDGYWVEARLVFQNIFLILLEDWNMQQIDRSHQIEDWPSLSLFDSDYSWEIQRKWRKEIFCLY